MASLASSIRSAARATSSAYRRLPIRWRIAGGSAALTLVILCGFAVVVGVLTERRIESNFNRQVKLAADDLQRRIGIRAVVDDEGAGRLTQVRGPRIDDYASGEGAGIRIVTRGGDLIDATANIPDLGPVRAATTEVQGWRVETRPVRIDNFLGLVYIQYARRISDVQGTIDRVRVFLAIGVLGGAALALVAGLATAERAISPIAQLTATARRIARTRDPGVRIPHPESEDEVAELASTLDEMLKALDDAHTETESALARQKEFVADASHELRTPLTAVLANLELLEDVLEGEERETAASALRSARRMRRLVADLLLLARADTGRQVVRQPVDLSEIVRDAAGELEPVAGDHPLSVDAPPGMKVHGARDELHRLVLNLLENGVRHTDPGTAVEATVERQNGDIVLSVEDDGPGIPPELREKVFERFFRGAGDRSGSSGLGLAIVKAVTDAHEGSVQLADPLDGRGARFVVRLPSV